MNNIINGVYVELDCIVDTRLSIMYDVDKNIVEPYLKNGKYFKRIMDQFGYISVRLFRTIYKMRNNNTLDNPAPTEIPDLISDYCFEALQTSKSLNDGSPINVYLNIYPYTLTTENIEYLRMGFSNNLRTDVNVIIINKPPYEITPDYINENMGMVVMYDALWWIEYNMQNKRLLDRSLPDVTFLTPMLLHRKLIIKETEINKLFEDLENNLKMLVGIIFIPVKYFSLKQKK